jgi:hypothetical protein
MRLSQSASLRGAHWGRCLTMHHTTSTRPSIPPPTSARSFLGMGAGFSGLFSSSGLSGFFGFPISQPNERDKPNKPDKRDRPVSALPTAAACGLKDADPAAKPLHVISCLLDTSVITPRFTDWKKAGTFYVSPVSAGVRSVEGSHGVPRVTGCCRGLRTVPLDLSACSSMLRSVTIISLQA